MIFKYTLTIDIPNKALAEHIRMTLFTIIRGAKQVVEGFDPRVNFDTLFQVVDQSGSVESIAPYVEFAPYEGSGNYQTLRRYKYLGVGMLALLKNPDKIEKLLRANGKINRARMANLIVEHLNTPGFDYLLAKSRTGKPSHLAKDTLEDLILEVENGFTPRD